MPIRQLVDDEPSSELDVAAIPEDEDEVVDAVDTGDADMPRGENCGIATSGGLFVFSHTVTALRCRC